MTKDEEIKALRAEVKKLRGYLESHCKAIGRQEGEKLSEAIIRVVAENERMRRALEEIQDRTLCPATEMTCRRALTTDGHGGEKR